MCINFWTLPSAMNIYNVRSLSVSFRLFLYSRNLGDYFQHLFVCFVEGRTRRLRGLARHRYIDPESPKAVDKTLVDSALVYSGEVFARRECLQLAEAGEQTWPKGMDRLHRLHRQKQLRAISHPGTTDADHSYRLWHQLSIVLRYIYRKTSYISSS